ncbi:MAG: FAD:protein FMN transferase [Candidatus Moraniibacteriota bacterium]
MTQIKTASLIHSNHWVATEHEEKGTIMKTDVFIKLFSDEYSKEEMQNDILHGFQMFRDFEARFSRFREQSELSLFNASEGGIVSEEFFLLMKACVHFHKLTGGIFDPCILPVLEKIGYKGSVLPVVSRNDGLFSQLVFDEVNKTIQKPKDVFIDFGGIGKGYIVDKVADELSKKYTNGIVDAGGDIRAFGGDKEQALDYFAIDVEDFSDETKASTMVVLPNSAIATSGINRRNWHYKGEKHHHIIDPVQKTSAKTDVIQVTVIAPYAVEADVFAKTLLILGLEKGMVFAEKNRIPALFVGEDKKITTNSLFQKYEWKA